MKKRKLSCKIYTLSELKDKNLSDKDLYNLWETDSLLFSLIIAQFRTIGDKRSHYDIIQECKENQKWVYQYFFESEKKREEFTNEVAEVLKNLYQYKDCTRQAQWFMFQYGFYFET